MQRMTAYRHVTSPSMSSQFRRPLIILNRFGSDTGAPFARKREMERVREREGGRSVFQRKKKRLEI